MSTPLWAAELARDWWSSVGGPKPFPRALIDAIVRAPFNLTVKELSHLTVRRVERYLKGESIRVTCGGDDRPLRGCLVARDGVGFIFLDADDPHEERTFSLAHELAHFLRDYLQPRTRAAAALGDEVLEVFDGLRRPRPKERLHALLRGPRAEMHLHLMVRDGGLPPAVAAAERDADRLACELLAPADEVLARLRAGAGAAEAVAMLRQDFGLPAAASEAYARDLFPPPRTSPLMEGLKKAWQARRAPPTGGEQ